MTRKEYKARLEDHVTYGGYDYLYPEEVKELRSDIKERKANGEIVLEAFNKRASIKQNGNVHTLTSYYTDVISFDASTGEIKKLWQGYSATTLKHINIFLNHFGITGLNKKEWIALDIAS